MQNSYRMQSFDLEPIRNQLRARVEECFQNFMKRAVEPVLSPKIGMSLSLFLLVLIAKKVAKTVCTWII